MLPARVPPLSNCSNAAPLPRAAVAPVCYKEIRGCNDARGSKARPSSTAVERSDSSSPDVSCFCRGMAASGGSIALPCEPCVPCCRRYLLSGGVLARLQLALPASFPRGWPRCSASPDRPRAYRTSSCRGIDMPSAYRSPGRVRGQASNGQATIGQRAAPWPTSYHTVVRPRPSQKKTFPWLLFSHHSAGSSRIQKRRHALPTPNNRPNPIPARRLACPFAMCLGRRPSFRGPIRYEPCMHEAI